MPKTERFAALDFLRGAAALCVLLMHWLDGQGAKGFANGYLAVDFFFLLSGFVIAHSYEARLLNAMPIAKFLRARLIRLYPMILAGILLGLAREIMRARLAHELDFSVWEAARLALLNALMIPTIAPASFGGDNIYPLDNVLWSLFFELVANAAYALAVRRLSTRALTGLVLLSLAALMASIAAGRGFAGGMHHDTFLLGFPRVGFSFFLGVLLHRLRAHGQLAKPSAGPLALSLLLIAPMSLAAPLGNWAALAVVGLLSPAVVVLGANAQLRGPAARASDILGALSYPVYVLQVPLMWILTGALKQAHLYNAALAVPMSALAILVVCACSWAALKLYDEPVRRALSARGRCARTVAQTGAG